MAKKTKVKKSAVKKSAKKKAPTRAKKSASRAASGSVIKPPAMPKAKASAVVGDVEHLMEMMVAHDVTEIDIEDGPRKIVLKRGSFAAAMATPTAMAPTMIAAPAPALATAPAEAPAAEEKSDLIEITSPMVGTFYASSSPDSDPFASAGANVTDNTVVCIVEAMKVMNEIKAECSGTVAEVCVKNAEPVEFGQVLFKVKPA